MIHKAWTIFKAPKWNLYVQLYFFSDRFKLGADICREVDGWIELGIYLGVWEINVDYHRP